MQLYFLSLIKALYTFPTYCGSEPMYSSSTKNWFHTQPLLTLWNPLEPPFLPAADGPIWLWGHSCPGLLWTGAQELCSKRKHRNSSRQFLLSIGRTVMALFPGQGPEEKGERQEIQGSEAHKLERESSREGVRVVRGLVLYHSPRWRFDSSHPGNKFITCN